MLLLGNYHTQMGLHFGWAATATNLKVLLGNNGMDGCQRHTATAVLPLHCHNLLDLHEPCAAVSAFAFIPPKQALALHCIVNRAYLFSAAGLCCKQGCISTAASILMYGAMVIHPQFPKSENIVVANAM